MPKVLSKSGDSLADLYDVEGSVAGIEDLYAREVSTIHEMGGTIFSERMGGDIRRLLSGAIGQSTNISVVDSTMPPGITRILGASVIVNTAARMTSLMLAVRDPSVGREFPFFVWTSNQAEETIRIVENGAAVANMNYLVPLVGTVLPTFIFGGGQPAAGQVPDVVMRGTSSAFGAGTVSVFGLVYVASANPAGITDDPIIPLISRGLPVPGW